MSMNPDRFRKVFILQKRILRTMLKLPLRTSCRDHFKRHDILTLFNLYILKAVFYIKKNISKFVFCDELHYHNTRFSKQLYVPRCRLTRVNKGPIMTAMNLYNKLPISIKELDDIYLFKKKVKNYLNNVCCYSLQEYYLFKLFVIIRIVYFL